MTKCRMPELRYERAPCHMCGAVTEKEAETKCKPSTDPTSEWFCGSDFDSEGYSVQPTTESLQVQDAWINLHHDCFEECLVDGEIERDSKESCAE